MFTIILIVSSRVKFLFHYELFILDVGFRTILSEPMNSSKFYSDVICLLWKVVIIKYI